MRLIIPHKNERDKRYQEDMTAIETWRDRTIPDTPWNVYTPVLTGSGGNPTLGTGNIRDGRWQRIERTAFIHLYINVGAAGYAAGTGDVRISLPSSIIPNLSNNTIAGFGWTYSGTSTLVIAEIGSATYITIRANAAAGSVPWASIAASGLIALQLVFEAQY